MFKSNKILVPKSFKSSDGNYMIELKDSIHGYSEIGYDTKIFRGSYPVFEINVDNSDRLEIVLELKDRIIDIYKRGIKNKSELSSEELVLFYFIKEVKDISRNTQKDMLVIGYDYNNLSSIKSVALKFGITCDHLDTNKNVELYNENDFESIYKSFIRKTNKNKYNKFILDITNLYLPTDYSNTKKIINQIKNFDGKILFLIDHFDTTYDRFVKVIGEEYKDSVVDKTKFLYAEQSLYLYKIKRILFE